MRSPTIEKLLRLASEDSNVISFAGGLPADETLSRAALAQAASDAMMELKEGPLQYGWAEGSAGLRELIARRLRARGAHVLTDEVIITNGAQEGLALILDVLANGVAFDPGCLFRADPSKAGLASFQLSFSCVPQPGR